MVIHQTLHGYADGHRLLASSTPLSTEEQHRLAVLSDITGHAAGVSFDGYLSGYPVRHGLYALARTWPATEVDRAGSVWTHTLLVDAAGLDDVRDPSPLVALFRRPDASGALPYSTPTEVPDPALGDDRLAPPDADAGVVAEILAHLYDPSAPRAVRLVADACAPWEPLVLALWCQQWPSLRARFAFCTLALGEVRLGDTPFVLQVSPRSRAAGFAPDERIAVVDAAPASRPPPADAPWVQAAAADLLAAPGARRLRVFLRRFGVGVPETRAAFASLAGIHAGLEASASVDEGDIPTGRLSREGVQRAARLASLVGERFPAAEHAARLKIALFGGVAAPEPVAAGVSEAEMILALSITRAAGAFDAETLAVTDRASRLLETDRSAAVRLAQAALEVGLNAIGKWALGPLVSGAGGAVLTAAVARNVLLATNVGLWSTPPEARRTAWDAVRSIDPAKIDEATRAGIVRAMLAAGCPELADAVVAHFGEVAVPAVLAWVAATPGTRLDPAWTAAVGRNPATLVSVVLGQRPLDAQTLAALAEALSPDSDVVRGRPLDAWVDVAARVAKVVPDPIDFKAFLLALALDQKGPEAASIAVLTFQPVYDAAREQKLGGAAWSHLQGRVPRILRQWDHCERLRRGIAVRFAREDWPMTYLPQVVRGELTLDLLLGHCLETEAGRRFVVRVVKGVPRPIRWGAAQRAVVQRFVAKAAASQRAAALHE